MKTKIGSTKKILAASVALLASLGVAAGSTFAWFTTSETVSTGSFTATVVSASDSLTMAVAPVSSTYDSSLISGLRFGQTVTGEAIETAIGADAKIGAYSSTDGNTFNGLGNDGAVGAAVTPAVNQATGGLIQFRLIFRNLAQESVTQTLHLTSGSIEGGSGATVPYVTATASERFPTVSANAGNYGSVLNTTTTNTIRAFAAHAARVAFIPAYTGATVNAATVKTWAPNERYSNGSNTDTTGTQQSTAAGYYLGNLAGDYNKDYLGNSNYSQTQVALTNSIVVDPTTTISALTTTSQVTAEFGSVTGVTGETAGQYVYTSIIVSLWLEGTDGDCFDAILKDTFETTLAFTVKTVATPQNP